MKGQAIRLQSAPQAGAVSVPLRGSGDESFESFLNESFESAVFQSPCGEVVMKVEQALRNLRVEADVSVPLRGSGDESDDQLGHLPRESRVFQSPCGEVVMKDLV